MLSYLSSLAVLKADPDSYRSHQLRAQLLEESNDDAGAIAEYRDVLKRKPELQNIHFAIGTLYWKDQHSTKPARSYSRNCRTIPIIPKRFMSLVTSFHPPGTRRTRKSIFWQP